MTNVIHKEKVRVAALCWLTAMLSLVTGNVLAQMRTDGEAFRLYNIVPMYIGHETEQAARCIEMYERTGADLALYSLTLHPEGNPARAKVDRYIASYRAFAKALEGTKVRPGVLVQAILGHWRRIDKEVEPWMRSVDHEGKVARFCPLDPGYADYIDYVFTEIAKCRPAFVLTDDDVRVFVYGGTGAECFCARHVAKFNALRGTHHDSKSLAATIRASKQGDPDYEAFHVLQCELIEDLVLGRARAALDAVDPQIPGGVCLANAWSCFGAPAARRMAAKGQRPLMRAPTGCYLERLTAARFPEIFQKIQRYVEFYRDSGTDVLDEADTCPHNLWSKSARAFYTHLVAAAFAGMRGAKIWHVNGIKASGAMVPKAYTDVLARHRGQLDALAKAVEGTRGVGLAAPCFTNAPGFHPTENCFGNFTEPSDLEGCLFAFGLPLAASRDFGDPGRIIVLSRKSEVNRLTDDELRQILSGRVLVLREAAVALDARGLAKWIGTSAREEPLQFTSEYDLLNGATMAHSSSYAGSVRFVPAEGARTLSEFRYRDPVSGESAAVAPASVHFRNELGGEVVTCGYHAKMLALELFSGERKRWLVSVVDLLSGADRFALCEEDQDVLMAERRSADGTRIVLAVNLNSEPIENLRLRVPAGKKVERLADDGSWAVPATNSLGFYEVAVFRIR